MGTPIYGIDVSRYQGKIDWQKVKDAGIQFAIIRAGYGREIKQKDSMFEENYAGCKAIGLPVGAYWYSYADTTDRAKQEAQTFLEAIKGKQFEYPVWFDQEYEPAIKALTNQKRTDIVKTFCDAMESAGYYTGIYCSRDWINSKLISGQIKSYDVWVAAYTNSDNPGSVALPYGMWQYSSKGSVPGISGNVDLDAAYKDYPSIIRKAGLNGYTK